MGSSRSPVFGDGRTTALPVVHDVHALHRCSTGCGPASRVRQWLMSPRHQQSVFAVFDDADGDIQPHRELART